MRIGIDMIGGQSPHSRGRGIGRHTLNFVKSLLERDRHDYVLYLHRGLPDAEMHFGARAAVVRLASPEGRAAGPVLNEIADQNPDRLDWLLLTSPAETSNGYFAPRRSMHGPRMATVMYDLIPLLFPETLPTSPPERACYHRALEQLKRYDMLLATSSSTVADCRQYLAIDEARLKVVYPGGDASFFCPDPPSVAARQIGRLRELGVDGPFAFTVSGTPEHKNLAGLLAAFSRLPCAVRDAHQLVVTCASDLDWKRRMRELAMSLGVSDRVVLTNHIDDETLRTLYRQCAAFVFPSRYEGFGLPLVEAMQCGAPVLAGRNSSQIEVTGDAGALVNVDDAAELTASLGRLLTDVPYANRLRQLALERGRRFSWQATSEAALAALEHASSTPRNAPPAQKRFGGRPRPRIALLSPLLPSNSGIAEYSANLIQALREHCAIDLFHDHDYRPLAEHSGADYECFDHRLLPRLVRARRYRQIIYQMGNSLDHRFVYEAMLAHGGILVLHDAYLPDFHFGYALRTGAGFEHIAREMQACSPQWTDEFLANHPAWDREEGGLSGACLRRGITFAGTMLKRATAVIVHDRWSCEHISAKFPDLQAPVVVVPHGARTYDVSAERRRAVRAHFGLPQDGLLLGSFGNLQWHKCNEEAIEAFAEISRTHPDVGLVFVGRDVGHGAARAKAAALGLEQRVHFIGYASRESFIQLAAATDVAINLRRPPTHGETSGALLILLGAGVPTVVTDVDAFSSYPDTVVRKVSWGESPVALLQQVLHALIESPDERRRISRASQEFVRQRHDWGRVAAQYAAVCDAYARDAPDTLRQPFASRRGDGTAA